MQKNSVSLLVLLGLGLIPGLGLSQRGPISLSAVTVRAPAPDRFLAGQKVQRIDSAQLRQFRFQSLSELLALNSSLIFKSYGPGQLTTVAFRGTSPNHTAVLWNGINVNQPMTGQTDFSTLPTVGFDQIAVQYGSAASVIGSDAVGGSLLLRSLPDFPEPGQPRPALRASVGYQAASFENGQGQAVLNYGGKGAFSGKSVVYGNAFNNRFPYRERSYYYVEPSVARQRGLMQDLYWRNRHNGQWSLNAWLTDHRVTISPADTLGRERTQTDGYRLLTGFEGRQWTVRAGWLRDVLDYARGSFSTPSHSLTDRYLARLEREFTGPGWQLRLGGEAVHYRSRVDGYGGRLITENRADLYALYRYQSRRLTLSANLRQAFITRFNPPPAPSFGADYQLLQQPKHRLMARASVGRSYRVPTLNERYWRVLGNPDLRPERGVNGELGLSGEMKPSANWLLTAEVTAFGSRINDWTYWNPDRNYRVENLQLVVTRGLETSASGAYARGGWRLGGKLHYGLTRSSQETAHNQYARDILGKQLPYVPVHTGTITLYAAHQQLRLTVQSVLQSRRYSTFDNSQALGGIQYTNLVAQIPCRLGPMKLQLQAQVNNLFDALILNVKQNAMPGRNYALSVIVNTETR